MNRDEAVILNQWIGSCRCLYNLGLEQRKMIDYREQKLRGDSVVSYYTQANELSTLKAEFVWFKQVPGQALQNALRSLDVAFQKFFQGEAGYPKRKKKTQSVGVKIPKGSTKTNPNGNFWFPEHQNPKKGYIKLPKIKQPLRFYKHREMEGEVKSVTIKKEGKGFYISVLCDVGEKYDNIENDSKSSIGIDLGITRSIAVSNGEFFDLPTKKIKEIEVKIGRMQNRLALKTKFSNSWRKLVAKINLLHRKITQIRKDFLWKTAHNLSKNHAVIALEDLKAKNMSASAKGTVQNPGKRVAQKSGLNRSILRQGWYDFSQKLEWQAKKHGARIIYVPAHYTSQTCSSCGHKAKENRSSQADFLCVSCGHAANADTNAALNIMNLAAARAVQCHEEIRASG